MVISKYTFIAMLNILIKLFLNMQVIATGSGSDSEGSTYSSFYSSFMKTSDSENNLSEFEKQTEVNGVN